MPPDNNIITLPVPANSDPFDNDYTPPNANFRRGTGKWTKLAVEFIKKYPIDTWLRREQIDAWFQKKRVLSVPPADLSKDDDRWIAHHQRRQHALKCLRKASTHPRLNDTNVYGEDVKCFVVVYDGGRYQVRPPLDVIVSGRHPRKMASIWETQRQHIRDLMQGTAWNLLPESERDHLAGDIEVDMKLYEEQHNLMRKNLSTKLHRIESRLRTVLTENKARERFLRKDETE